MTREEAIRRIECCRNFLANNYSDMGEPNFTAFNMAIKALEQEPCDDVISRQAVNDAINDVLVKYIPMLYGSCEKIPLELITAIMQLPPVNPQEPKTGHWSRKTKVDAYDIAGVKTWGIKCQCDRCDFTTIVVEDFGYYKYCPNCGARMESEVRNE